MEKAGCEIVVMEVASQGLKLHRTQGFTFELGIFTNLEPDHIGPNEHADFEEYRMCKGLLFQQCRHGIVNKDDENLEELLKGHTCTIETYGFDKTADLYAEDLELVKKPGELGIDFLVALFLKNLSGCIQNVFLLLNRFITHSLYPPYVYASGASQTFNTSLSF